MNADARLSKTVADFYETHGPSFARTRHAPWGIMKLIIERLRSDDVLIDVGAGNGRLAKFLPKDIRYVGIEPSSSLCSAAGPVLTERGEGEMRQGGFPTVPAADGEADFVACLAVLHHISGLDERRAAIAELHRILKPNGQLVLTVWNLRGWQFASFRTWLAGWFRLPLVHGGEFGDVWVPWKAEGASANRYVHAFTLRELRSLFGPGWEIEQCVPWAKETATDILDGKNLVVIAHKK